ncbi:NUDIX hydrolase [Aequorivita sp. SDUM287046]|uniref:GDP-mannose pyrophosphatase n=1 Tax=Aequorivita aurantiaca TaxID=3053356 RepID=A0ABT8DN93_9FLAO|nr:NUDIX hydrolase [Aequorivita aurantiaca]MDN3724537.1 NUDIX hydrolase [Aequorivita aurantiaca]
MKYNISEEKIVFDDHYKIVKAKITYDTFRGKKITANRLAFERGDSVAVLLLEKESQSVLLTQQFRYPGCKAHNPWLCEIPAGSIDKNESPENCAEREVMEELGYKINQPKLINTFYSSPGASTERIFLFYSEISEKDKVGIGGGNAGEKEDIRLLKIPVSEIPSEILKIKDAKTIVALQWYLIQQKK